MKNDGYTVAQDGKTWAFDEMDYEVDKTEKEELLKDLSSSLSSMSLDPPPQAPAHHGQDPSRPPRKNDPPSRPPPPNVSAPSSSDPGTAPAPAAAPNPYAGKYCSIENTCVTINILLFFLHLFFYRDYFLDECEKITIVI